MINEMLDLTFTSRADATPGAVVLANTRGGAGEAVALGTGEMNLVSDKVLRAKLGTKSWGSQRGAGGGSCRRGKKEHKRNASHMWRKPPNILWHSAPGDIHVSLGSAEASREKMADMPNLQSHSNEPAELQQQPSAAVAAAAARVCVQERCTLE